MEKHDMEQQESFVENVNEEALVEQKKVIEKQIFETKNKMRRDYYIGIGVLAVAILLVSIFTFSAMNGKGSRLVLRMVDSLRNDFGYLSQPFEEYGMRTDMMDDFTGYGTVQMNVSSGLFDMMEPSDEYQQIIDFMETFNQLKFQYSFQANSKNQQRFQMQWNSMLGDEKLIELFVSLMDQDGYLFLEGLYDRYLKFSLDEKIYESKKKDNLSDEDLDYLLDATLQSLFHHLTEDYFERKTVTINLNGKDKRVNQVNLVMNDDHFGSLMDHLIDDLKQDEKIVSLFAQLGYSFDQYQTPTLGGEEFEIRMYETKFTHKLVRYEFVYGNVGFSYTANKKDTFEIYVNNDLAMRAIVKPNDLGYDIDLIQWDETELGHLSVLKNSDGLSLQMDVNYNQMKMNVDISSLMNRNGQEYSDVTKLHMDVSMAGINFVSFDINEDFSLKKGSSMKDIDVSNSILMDDLTEADYEQIGLKFLELMERLFGTDLSVLD